MLRPVVDTVKILGVHGTPAVLYILPIHFCIEQVKTMEAKIFTQDLLTDEPQTPTPGKHAQHNVNILNTM